MNNHLKKLVCAAAFCAMAPALSRADVITFNFTGGLVITYPPDLIVPNYNTGSPVTPISATLSYDTASGFGSSNLSVTSGNFFGAPFIFHDISMARQPGTNLVVGQVMADWFSNLNNPFRIEWDATGFLNAISYGLQAGDIISGTNLYRDTNGNGVGDTGEFLTNVFSATPYSDILQTQQGYNSPQGPAPLAATSGTMGAPDGTPFAGLRAYIDIGSGNSMHVVSVTAVPVPAAAWLLGSGLAGLFGVSRRRKET